MIVKLAKLYFDIQPKYQMLANMCKEYECEHDASEKIYEIRVSDKEILSETPDTDFREPEYLETLAVYRKISEILPSNDGYLFHAAVIEANGVAIAFTAKSGTGKTTHIRLWKKVFGDRVGIVNGDKPLMRFIDGKLYAFGTPWSGKENYNRNVGIPLHAIVILNRGDENKIEKISPKEAAPKFLSQIYLPKNNNALFLQTLALADKTLKDVPVYRLFCNMENDAAITTYNAIFDNDNK